MKGSRMKGNRIRGSGKTASGLAILILIAALAAIGPAVSGYAFDSQRIEEQNMAPRIPILEKTGFFDGGEKVSGFSGSVERNRYKEKGLEDTYYWFGSDSLGRDIFTRTWIGARLSLCIAFLAAFVDGVLGAVYGMVSGYFGGKTDFFMQRFSEIISGVPNLVIATLLIIAFKPGFFPIVFSISITGWIGMSRAARAKMLEIRELEYVTAARTQGAGHARILFREIFPNMAGHLAATALLIIPEAVFLEAFLAFIGLGVPAPYASLGTMISDGFQVFTIHPYMIIPPAAVLAAIMLGFHLTAEGLREGFCFTERGRKKRNGVSQ